ncbi:NADH-quinone oxidoreductase subunit C [Desulfurococcaceae archaeon MEX13E-LK6-19]|nr:NADH-quinone oxidoreductase subunit C [Desulfurococcaceae archaeon MEX13E-LK6-19]
MQWTSRVDKLVKALGENVKEVKQVTPNQFVIVIDKTILPKAVKLFVEELGGSEPQLSIMVGNDERPLGRGFSITYWFSVNAGEEDLFIGLRTRVDEKDPSFPSITPYLKGAEWYEREVLDLLGLKPVGHPDPRRLVLPDDWPDDVYPLRKDFPYNKSPISERKYPYKEKKDYLIVPFGPYHVSLDEPAHFRLFVKGEEIVDVDYRGFYSHRGIEKLSETRLTYNQVCFIAERVCGICGCTHSTAYCQAVEAIAGVTVPERAEYIRTIMLEIERLHSHLLWIGVACHLLGFDLGFMHSWRIREKVMWLAEKLTGNRKTYGINLVGGVRRDFLDYRIEEINKCITELKKEFKNLVNLITSTRSFIKRCKDVGILPLDLARKWCTVGPLARGSGRKIDVRKDHPYAAYKELDFKVPVYTEGDVLARAMVRIEEVYESIWIIEQALDKLPKGPILEEPDEIPAYKEALGYTEAPRGENVHYVMSGPGNRVYRYRIRAATYNNLPAARDMLIGYTVADAPLIIASIDPCYSCTERVIVIDVRDKSKRVYSEKELVYMSRRKSMEV